MRLLDFGIAKLLEGEIPRETELTVQAGRALTLDYASPEQVRGEPLGAASDVYSLGVVAYELLTGARPYHLKRQGAAALEEAIASVDVRPASATATDPATRRALRGDLDAILNRALKKDVRSATRRSRPCCRTSSGTCTRCPCWRGPTRRPTARAPSCAAMPGRWRRAAPSPWRSWPACRWALWQAHEAPRPGAPRRSRAGLHQAGLQRQRPRTGAGPRTQRARAARPRGRSPGDGSERTTRGAGRTAARDRRHPAGAGRQRPRRSHISRRRSRCTNAWASATARVQAWRAWGWRTCSATSTSSMQRRPSPGACSPWRRFARPAAALGSARHRRHRVHRCPAGPATASASALELALANHQRGGYAPNVETVDARVDLGHAYMSLEQYTRARDAFAMAVAEEASVPEVTTKHRLTGRMYLQYARFFLNEDEGVLRDLPAVVQGLEQHLGLKSGTTLAARTLWAQVLVRRGRYEEGVRLQRDNVALAQSRTTLDDSTLAFQRGVLALLLLRAERHDEGIAAARQALAFMDAKSPAPNWIAENVRIVLGELQRASGEPEAALRTLAQAHERAATLAGHERSIRYARLLKALALAKHDLGQEREAAADLRQALAMYESFWPADPEASNARVLRAWMAAHDRPADDTARAAFDAAATAYAALQPPEHVSHRQLALLRADLQRRRADSPEARAQWVAATQAWERFAGRPWQAPVSVLH